MRPHDEQTILITGATDGTLGEYAGRAWVAKTHSA